MKRHKWLLTLLLAVFLLGGGAFLLWQTGFFSSVGSLEEMRNYIERFAPYSHLFFFLIQLLSVVIAPIPSNVTALAGAVLFGMWPSFLMTWLAVAGGSVLVFWLARVLGQRFVERLVNQRVADKYLEVIRSPSSKRAFPCAFPTPCTRLWLLRLISARRTGRRDSEWH